MTDFVKTCVIRLTDFFKGHVLGSSENMSSRDEQTLAGSVLGKRLRDRSTIKKPYCFVPEILTKMRKVSDDRRVKVKNSRKRDLEESEEEEESSDIENVNTNEGEEEEEVEADYENDYDALVAKNIKDKEAFLNSLKISEVKEELLSSIPGTRPKPVHRGIRKEIKTRKSLTPMRKSNRLLRLEPDGQPLVDEPKIKTYAYPNSSDVYKTYTPRLPVHSKLGLKQICAPTDVDCVEQFLNGLSGDLTPHIRENLIYDKETLNRMVNSEELIAKVVPDRIYSMAVHPDVTRRRLVAAGGKTGYLGLWDVGSSEGQDGVFLFRPCHDSLNCLQFKSSSLICCSYEGTLKRLDLNTGDFHHLHATPDNELTRCTHFDAISDDCYLVSHSTGEVVLVDSRTPGLDAEKVYECHEKPVKTVHVHPLKKDYFLTASNDRSSCLWDVRCFKRESPVARAEQTRSINSAYFSPVTGNSFVTVSYDNSVRVYDCTSLGPGVKQTFSARHNNQVGRWVTPFRALWIPNQEELVALGSMEYPRDIRVFDVSACHKVHSFTSDYMGSIVPIITFHPRIPFVAGGNASGKVYIFEERSS